jgi:hypothetical protein
MGFFKKQSFCGKSFCQKKNSKKLFMKIFSLEKKVNWLLAYSFSLTVVLGVFMFSSFNEKEKVTGTDVLNVKRINVIEDDGTVKMIIANKSKFPNGDLVNGKPTGRTGKNSVKRPGILFFNDEGVECGGLIYSGETKDGATNAGMSLTFDQYNQDQVIQILNSEYFKDSVAQTSRGIAISDRTRTMTIEEQTKLMDSIQNIQDKTIRRQEMNKLMEQGAFGNQRLFLGKTRGNSSGLFLADEKGKMKMMIYVDEKGAAKIEFFNDKGEVVNSITDKK